MKINKKGFAISTMLYGLIFITIAIFYMIINIVSDRNQTNTQFVNEVREELSVLVEQNRSLKKRLFFMIKSPK